MLGPQLNRFDERADAVVGAVTTFGEKVEPSLDRVQPRLRGGREVQMPSLASRVSELGERAYSVEASKETTPLPRVSLFTNVPVAGLRYGLRTGLLASDPVAVSIQSVDVGADHPDPTGVVRTVAGTAPTIDVRCTSGDAGPGSVPRLPEVAAFLKDSTNACRAAGQEDQ